MCQKLIATLVSSFLLFGLNQPINAAETPQPTLAIIDSALNSQMSQFKDKVVFEACVLDWPSCPNGKAFMEGPGSAALSVNLITKNGNDHGVKMVSAALTTNPNLKIVFVRYRGTTLDGTPQITNESSFVNAFKWVWDNRQRFNIQAVAMSQGHGNFAAGQADYCPKTPATQAMLTQFANAGIPVFLPAGNNRDQKRVNWPSCFPEAVTISATSAGDGIAIYSNFDINRTDFFAPGTLNVLQGDGTFKNEAGTSVSVQVAAAIWMHVKSKNPNLTYSEMMAFLNTQGEQIVGRTWKDVKIRVLNKYQFIK